MPAVSTNIEAIDGETPGGLPAGSVLNLYDSCNLAAQGITDPLFKSVLVQASSGTIKVGYRTGDPKVPGPVEFSAIDHKWWDLRKVVVKLTGAGDKAVFIASR